MHSFPVRIAAAALVAVSLTACGGSDESSDEPSATPSDESSSAVPTEPATKPLPPSSGSPSAGNPPPTDTTPMPPAETQPTEDPTVDVSKQRLSGVPTEGVESGCVVMTSGGETYQLNGLHPSHLGAKVVVEGMAKPDQMGTCMQGIPFEVTKVVSSKAPDDPR